MSMRMLTGFGRGVDFVYRVRNLGLVLTLGLTMTACAGSISRDTYAGMAAQLQAKGRLRTDPAPADAPYSARDLEKAFKRIAFSYEFQFKNGRIVNKRLDKPLNRWDGLIRYKIIGDAVLPGDARQIAELTDRISDLTGLRFERTDGRHDMLISIATKAGQADISEYLGARSMPVYKRRYDLWRRSPNWVCGATLSGAADGSGQLVFAHVFVGAQMTGILRQSCFHEEITQALGLTNDYPKARPSIFNDDQEFALLTDHDATLLSMLYDPELRPGMSRKEAISIIRSRIPEHIAQVSQLSAPQRMAKGKRNDEHIAVRLTN